MSRRIKTVRPVRRNNRMSALRADRDLTQRQVADALGWSLSRVHIIEHDGQPPATPDERKALAALFGVPESEVFRSPDSVAVSA